MRRATQRCSSVSPSSSIKTCESSGPANLQPNTSAQALSKTAWFPKGPPDAHPQQKTVIRCRRIFLRFLRSFLTADPLEAFFHRRRGSSRDSIQTSTNKKLFEIAMCLQGQPDAQKREGCPRACAPTDVLSLLSVIDISLVHANAVNVTCGGMCMLFSPLFSVRTSFGAGIFANSAMEHGQSVGRGRRKCVCAPGSAMTACTGRGVEPMM